MTALTAHEVKPGVVVQLDTDALRRSGSSRTNAEKTADEDRAVEGEHSFLVIEVDQQTSVACLTPIFSKWAPGSEQLRDAHKSGFANKWVGVPLYFNKWQHWQTPINEIVRESHLEDTIVGDRRLYAASAPGELTRILSFSHQNRADWRTLHDV